MIYDQASQVQIHLNSKSKWAARLALYRDGKLSWTKALKFSGPDFKETENFGIEVSVGNATVNVVVSDKHNVLPDVEYIYPLSSVGRVKIVA